MSMLETGNVDLHDSGLTRIYHYSPYGASWYWCNWSDYVDNLGHSNFTNATGSKVRTNEPISALTSQQMVYPI